MQGQWLGKINGELQGTLRIELEDAGPSLIGTAYLFYKADHNVPGFSFELNVPKYPPHRTRVVTTYLYTAGGEMNWDARREWEAALTERFGAVPIPASFEISLALQRDMLRVEWDWGPENKDSLVLNRSIAGGKSGYSGVKHISCWAEFRQWAVDQRPRDVIFRGQQNPWKLASTFHRTRRSDLRTWIAVDVQHLYGVLADRLSFVLDLNNLNHNSAFWSILQHHGYPTPLLDWTFSPFVAAYFAFVDANEKSKDRPRIYAMNAAAWTQRYGRTRFTVDNSPPQLTLLQSMQVANPRSAPQQALATVTNIADVEAFIREREQEDGTSYLTVCDLPVAERPQIMRELELMGITFGSLFPGIDGICRDFKERLFGPPTIL